eukprot:590199-Rhodomonas_salina.3
MHAKGHRRHARDATSAAGMRQKAKKCFETLVSVTQLLSKTWCGVNTGDHGLWPPRRNGRSWGQNLQRGMWSSLSTP